MLQGNLDDEIQRGLANVEASLNRLVEYSKERAFSVSIIALPEPSQGFIDYPDAAYQSKLTEIAERTGIKLFDLLPTLKVFTKTQKTRIVFPFDGHYTAEIQREFAGKVADYLSANHIDCHKIQALD